MIQFTPEMIEAYYMHMSNRFDATIITQDEIIKLIPHNQELIFVMGALEMMGVDPFVYISELSICVGRFVVVPFTPGSPGTQTQLRKQFINLAHELTHRIRWKNNPKAIFRYFASRSERAHTEAEANHPVLELGFRFTGKIPSTQHIAKKMVDLYLCRPADANVTRKHLNIYAMAVKQGAVGSATGKAAVKWLEKYT